MTRRMAQGMTGEPLNEHAGFIKPESHGRAQAADNMRKFVIWLAWLAVAGASDGFAQGGAMPAKTNAPSAQVQLSCEVVAIPIKQSAAIEAALPVVNWEKDRQALDKVNGQEYHTAMARAVKVFSSVLQGRKRIKAVTGWYPSGQESIERDPMLPTPNKPEKFVAQYVPEVDSATGLCRSDHLTELTRLTDVVFYQSESACLRYPSGRPWRRAARRTPFRGACCARGTGNPCTARA